MSIISAVSLQQSLSKLDNSGLLTKSSSLKLFPVQTLITVPPMYQYFTVGQSLTLACESSSDPSTPVSLTWLFDGVQIIYDSNIYQDSNGYLQIVSAEESNGGNYTCVASNGYSSAEADAQLLAW